MEGLEPALRKDGGSSSMIKYVEQQYLDLEKYNTCVKRDQSALPYASSWYLNTVCEQWDALVLNDYDAVWPLPFRFKLGLKYFFRPYGIQQLGIFSKKSLSAEQMMAFGLELQKHARLADIYLNEDQAQSLKLKGFRLEPQRNMLVDLNRSYAEIYQSFSTNLKRKLKKIEGEKFQLFEHEGPKALLRLFQENRGKELALDPEFYQNMEGVMFKAMHKNMARVFTVYGGPNQLLAGAFFLEHQGRAVFLFSAVSDMGRDLNAMTYLINEYLIYQSGKMQVLDFEGSNQEGLARFYQSFGAQERAYHRLVFNRLPWPLSKYPK